MKLRLLFAALLIGVSPYAWAAGGGHGDGHGHGAHDDELKPDAHVDVKSTFSGSTISVLAYRSFSKPVPAAGGAVSTQRLIFEAWLNEDGTARVREWDESTQAWHGTVSEKWTVKGDIFCLSAGNLAIKKPQLCLDTLIWGQVFSANSEKAEFLVKGNWKKGNVHGL